MPPEKLKPARRGTSHDSGKPVSQATASGGTSSNSAISAHAVQSGAGAHPMAPVQPSERKADEQHAPTVSASAPKPGSSTG